MRTLARAIGIAVAASLMAFTTPFAWAGDDGLGCCDDLLMRLSPKAADFNNNGTTFRFYGQLNRALLFWDDGKDSKTYAVDNDTSSTRLGVIGKFKPQGELVAGYRVEVDLRATSSSGRSRAETRGGTKRSNCDRRTYSWKAATLVASRSASSRRQRTISPSSTSAAR